MRRVLHIIGGLDRGGAESFIMNAWRNIDKSKYQFDILTFLPPREGKKFAYEDELIAGGAKIFKIQDNRIKAPLKFENDIADIVMKRHYEVVHSHIDFMSALSLSGAKKGGARNLVSHSHNTYNKNLNNVFKLVFSFFLRKRLNKIATTKLACGKEAGKFLYGPGQAFTVIPNGISLDTFKYSQKDRSALRNEFHVDETTKVLLNIGRLENVKNQAWLIELFETIFKIDNNIALFIIGNGTLRAELEKQIAASPAKEHIFLLDSRADIFRYYSLADIFVLPSKFEGVPTVGIEAQASGLKCLFSTFVPKEVKASNNVSFLDINSMTRWKKMIVDFEIPKDRTIDGSHLETFDIHNSVKKLEEAYDSI